MKEVQHMSLKKRYLRHFSAAAVLSLAFSSHALALDSLDIDKDEYTQGQYIGVSYTGVTQEEEDNKIWEVKRSEITMAF